MTKKKNRFSDQEALDFHAGKRPGKLAIIATKPMATQRDLSLAYSPGVAVPVRAIAENPDNAYEYTSKGNLVAVISNGTAILGMGDLGALASKPVMEGKAVLFKRFADVDAIDLEIDTRDVDEFVNCVRFLGPSFGGINLEDIKAPDCFIIEQRLREEMNIPVLHDDQHGTAIIAAAGIVNALYLTGKTIEEVQFVVNGAGSAAIACLELLKSMGLPNENVLLCDSKGVIYKGRTAGLNQWKSAHAVDTKKRTLADAMKGADVALGLSVSGAFTGEMIKSMAPQPIIFAMANPDPEITPEEVAEVRDDAIMATGRSDYPNQVNNVLGFPYIFRGALDVRATTINDEMKAAAAQALAQLAREDVPDEVAAAYSGKRPQFGREYIIPAPFDPRLIVRVAPAVAQAAMDTGVAGRAIDDMDAYRAELRARLDPTAGSLALIFNHVRANPKRVVFAEGEQEKVIRAAIAFRNAGYGTPVLVGREGHIQKTMKQYGIEAGEDLEIHNATLSKQNKTYTDYLYKRLQRRGHLYRDCERMVNQDRNVFAACMLAHGDVDAMITGVTRSYIVAYQQVRFAIDPKPGSPVFGLSVVVARDRTVLIADTSVNVEPTAQELADMAVLAAAEARKLGHEPRVALLSFVNFGYPRVPKTQTMHEAVRILDGRELDFEYDGEMAADVALSNELRALFPFCRLTESANVLIMPGLEAAHIASKMMQHLAGGTVIGPMLIGLEAPVQIAALNATSSDLVNLAALAAHDSGRDRLL